MPTKTKAPPKAKATPRPKIRTEDQAVKAETKAVRADALAAGAAKTDAALAGFVHLRHDQIEPDPHNDRRTFDVADLAALAASLDAHGLKTPLIVGMRPEGGAPRRLVGGERRWRAWGLLIADGRWPATKELPCKVEGGDAGELREAALIENACRVDLTHSEYADAFERLAAEHGRSNRQIADAIGRTIEFVQQHRGLVELDKKQRKALDEGRITFADARRIVTDKRKAEKAAAELTPSVRLVFVEVCCKIRAEARDANYPWWSDAEIDPTADDAALATLVKSGALRRGQSYQTQREVVSLQSYRFGDGLKLLFERLQDDAQRPEILAASRVLALGEAGAAAIEPDKYASAFLNGPWELPPDRQAELDRRAANETALEERKKADKVKAAETAKAFKALASEVRKTATRPLLPKLQTTFESAGVALPLVFKNGVIEDANGRAVNGYHNTVADRELAMRTLVLAANAALGFAKSSAEAVAQQGPDADDEDDDEDGAGEAEAAPDDGQIDLEDAIRRTGLGAVAVFDHSDGVRRTAGPLAAMLGDTFGDQLRKVAAEGGGGAPEADAAEVDQ